MVIRHRCFSRIAEDAVQDLVSFGCKGDHHYRTVIAHARWTQQTSCHLVELSVERPNCRQNTHWRPFRSTFPNSIDSLKRTVVEDCARWWMGAEVSTCGGTGGRECTSQHVGKNRRCQRACLNRRFAGSVGFYPRAARHILYPLYPIGAHLWMGDNGLTNGRPESIFVQLGRVILAVDVGHGRRLRGAERKAGGAEDDDEGDQRDGQRRHRGW
jgi:hypothetical protein